MAFKKILQRLGLIKNTKASDAYFSGHYEDWRAKRVKAITNYYGKEFFPGKSVLEVGCGYGDIGAEFMALGARVTCSDARAEHLQEAVKKHPGLRTVRADLDREWPFLESVDLVIHMGVLYHLKDHEAHLAAVCRNAKHLVLETEVLDSTDPYAVMRTEESGYDQAFGGAGCRPSTSNVERVLRENGMIFERIIDSRCNSLAGVEGVGLFHRYDWTEKNTGTWEHGLRRFWFCRKAATAVEKLADREMSK